VTADQPEFQLSRHIDRYLAALSKLYGQEGLSEKQEIIVNAQVRVQEEWSSDNWNGGTFGHALYLILPESLYLAVVRRKDDLQGQIKADLNKIHNVQHEFIEEVFLEMEDAEDHDWRRDSGLLQSPRRLVTPEGVKRIWGENGYRVFLSHKSEIKGQAGVLKTRLQALGVSCFVAHEDIHPTREWQEEIENALNSMDAFVALMTDGFHDSLWTDQEVGFALGRGVPIVAVRLGKDPYGFLGRFQALSCDWDAAPKELVRLFVKHPRMLDEYVSAVKNCSSFDEGNTLAEVLVDIQKLTDHQVQQLVSAFDANQQVSGCYGFEGTRPYKFGPGLAAHLFRLTGRKYQVSSGQMSEVQ